MAKKSAAEIYIEKAISSLPQHAHEALAVCQKAGKKPVVFVGVSGGVDSAVSAYILQKAGFDVRGWFIKVWQPDDAVCTWKEDRRDAMRVCAKLGIPFETHYAEDAYKKNVADYMIREYSVGRTPNPDIMCNKYVKFGVFFDFALENKVDFVATGHYAKTRTTSDGKNSKQSKDQVTSTDISADLLQSADENKDQTYFLWAVEGNKLAKVLFPVGGLTKDQVRTIAEFAGLHVSTKKDSQGVCFIGKIDMKDFIQQYIHTEPGQVLNTKGEVIGRHSGAILYTIGERHGFEIFTQTPTTVPNFVIQKNIDQNTITVGSLEDLKESPRSHTVQLEQVNFISKNTNGKGKKITARIRHRQKLQHVTVLPEVSENDGKITLKITFKEKQQGAAAGQSCVLYDGEVCLGGGIIS